MGWVHMIQYNMKTVCKIDQCTGCSVCKSKCARNAIQIKPEIDAYNALIDESLCIDCGQCMKMCPVNYPVDKKKPDIWYQGWSIDKTIRESSSSGGAATAISLAFAKNGGMVCSCRYFQGKFNFTITDKAEEILMFAGSKYIKSNPDGIYLEIKKNLSDGKRVLFIGLPCQVAAAKKYIGKSEGLYTVDLICHGTPTPKILDMFLSERGYELSSFKEFKFRKKTHFFLSDGNNSIEPETVMDRYTFAFLKGLCYTENCYSCQYATIERVADLTLGDSWGSNLTDEEEDGISLMLAQNSKGKELLEMAELHLEDVDLENAINNNKQLKAPSQKPEQYDKFIKMLKKHKNFNKAVFYCYPKECIIQNIKAFFIKNKIIK